MPKDIGLSVVDKYTLFIHNSETQDEGYCTIENANSWIKSNASEVWATDDDGKITRVTGPDWHSASWLSTDEVEELIKRYEALLEAMIPDAQKQMARMQEIAKDLEKDFDKKGNWKRYNPMNSHDLKLLRGMLAMMRTMETSDRPCRIVFYFDN
jgi:hypothetical protein